MTPQEQAARAAELYTAFAEGKTLQTRDSDGSYYTWGGYNLPTIFTHEIKRWRIKPEKTPVDMFHLIYARIDCDFTNGDEVLPVVGALNAIYGGKYISDQGAEFDKCVPRENHWHSWGNSDTAALPDGFKIEIQEWDEGYSTARSEDVSWKEVVAFKIIKLEDGYCYPWEVDE